MAIFKKPKIEFQNILKGVFLSLSFVVPLFLVLVLTGVTLSGGPLKLESSYRDYEQELTELKAEMKNLHPASQENHMKHSEWKALILERNKDTKLRAINAASKKRITVLSTLKYNKWIGWSWLFYILILISLSTWVRRLSKHVLFGMCFLPTIATFYTLFI